MLIALEDEIIIVALEARGAAREAMWRGPSAQCPLPALRLVCSLQCVYNAYYLFYKTRGNFIWLRSGYR